MKPLDVLHLTFRPPFASGSYNRSVGTRIERLSEFRHVALSHWKGQSPAPEGDNPSVITVNARGLSLWQKACLRVPERIRKGWFNNIADRHYLTYYWQIAKLLPRLRPKIIVCYDGYKMGPLLRQVIDWPCRLVLSQHGLSYFQPTVTASRLYNLQSFDTVCVLTQSSYRFDRRRAPLYEPLVSVIPNGVDTERFRPVPAHERKALREKWALPQEKLVVLLLSRLVPKKGAHVILHSWKEITRRVPEAFLWIVGGGDLDYERYLKRMIHALEVSKTVLMAGAVSANTVSTCYQASDLYLFPTLASEGMALSVLEGMSCGLACVVSEHDTARELYSDREAAFVTDPNVEDAFVEPVVHLLKNAARRQEMGQLARTVVQARYSQEIWLNRLREFYHRQLELVNGAQ